MKILINLLGGQNSPNYIAYDMIKPDKCIHVTSGQSNKQYEALARVIPNEKIEKRTVDAFNFSNCVELIESLFNEYSNDELILNLTGSTKILSIASFKVFNEHKAKMVYVDSQNNKLIELAENNEKTVEINSKITIEDYFKLYDQKYIEKNNYVTTENIENVKCLTEYLESNYVKICDLITKLAKMKNEDKRKFLNSEEPMIKKGKNSIHYYKKYDKFELNLTGFDKNPARFELQGKDSLDFITGGWFEYYVFEKLKTINFFDKLICNVEILPHTADNATIRKNEIDVVGIRNMTLYVFEIKTGKFTQDNLWKLKGIKETYGGTYTKIFLVSYFPPFDPIIGERLDELGIKLITQRNLKNIKDIISGTPNANL